MTTVREDISQVKTSVRAVHPDVRLSNQFVYNKLMDVTKLLVRRDAEMRKMFKSTELFTTIFCVEMKREPIKNCTNIFIPKCSFLSVSKIKLPKAFLSSSGSIINVFNVDRSVQFIQSSPAIYANIMRREFKGNQRYFWIENDYLYIPDTISEVIVVGMFIDPSEVSAINNPEIKCHSLLDSTSPIPDGLRMDVFRLVIQDIAGVTKRIPEDENTNGNSNN